MKNNEAEALLLSNASLDDLIKMKIEKEFMADLKKSKETKRCFDKLCDRFFENEFLEAAFNMMEFLWT